MTIALRPQAGAVLFVLCALVAPLFAPTVVRAEEKSTYTKIAARIHSSERYEQYRRATRESRELRSAINKLDEDRVEEMPIPVLLGVETHHLSKNFGDARGGGTRSHEGLDIMAPMGALVVSPTDAVVTRTGEGASAGVYVYTANPGGETFVYMHLSGVADGIESGAKLKKGDLIGYVGDSGNAKGGAPHLHFEIRDGREATDPYPRLTHEFSLEERIEVLTDLLAMLMKELERRA